ncbi:hypothetical protein [Clostridium sp. B9]|uniref:hypothetical protein n=1 Tax=Clostridium sp. B9 TaxID=3423224 RepID=UPI003D2F1A6B
MNGERSLNKSRGCIIFFPAFIMFLITTFVSSEIFLKESRLEVKEVMFFLLIIGFPIIFFLQGYLIYRNKMGIICPWIISMISFGSIAIIFYNYSALGYGIIYTVLEFCGYFAPKVLSRFIRL